MNTSTRHWPAEATGRAGEPRVPIPGAMAARHTILDDVQGVAAGSLLAAFGIAILTHLGLITGQTAGLAVLLSYVTGLPFGAVFFVVNLPFYWIGWRRKGAAFTLKTFAAVAGRSGMSFFMPGWLAFSHLHPVFGAVLFGLCSGTALLALFRHGASLGGVGILALLIQDRTGFRAGWTQLLFDAGLFATALLLLEPQTVAVSALGAVVLNLVIAINHRPERYMAY